MIKRHYVFPVAAARILAGTLCSLSTSPRHLPHYQSSEHHVSRSTCILVQCRCHDYSHFRHYNHPFHSLFVGM